MNNKTSIRARKKLNETGMNLYNINLLTPEIQILLLKSSNELMKQDLEWLMLAFEKVPSILNTMKNTPDFHNQCFVWFNQTQIVLMHCKSKQIEPTVAFLNVIQEIKTLTFSNLESSGN